MGGLLHRLPPPGSAVATGGLSGQRLQPQITTQKRTSFPRGCKRPDNLLHLDNLLHSTENPRPQGGALDSDPARASECIPGARLRASGQVECEPLDGAQRQDGTRRVVKLERVPHVKVGSEEVRRRNCAGGGAEGVAVFPSTARACLRSRCTRHAETHRMRQGSHCCHRCRRSPGGRWGPTASAALSPQEEERGRQKQLLASNSHTHR